MRASVKARDLWHADMQQALSKKAMRITRIAFFAFVAGSRATGGVLPGHITLCPQSVRTVWGRSVMCPGLGAGQDAVLCRFAALPVLVFGFGGVGGQARFAGGSNWRNCGTDCEFSEW